jgi:hypothetical protein
MKNRKLYGLSLIAAGVTASCGYTAPYHSSGPALSREGVQISLTAEQCYNNRFDEQYPTALSDDELHVGVRLNVINRSNHVAILVPAAFQLEENEGNEHTVMRPAETGSLSLPPGQSTDLILNFAEEAKYDCRHDLVLDAHHAIALEGKPVHLASIHFLPSR